jgi:ABC-type lipoprotein export system ATPase subunit
MQIELQALLPTFLEQEKTATSEVWGKSLRFQPGERVQIVATSGRGKTSFIHFLYGLRKDYDGQLQCNGRPAKTFDAEQLAQWRQRHISVVFQDLRLFAGHTVLDNINIKRVLNPYHPVEKIQAMADQLGIGNKLPKLAQTCSYGEQQRIAIIRALMQPFDFLLLDEPFSHLDEANRQRAMQLMEEEATARKAAIILADLKRIEYFKADRIIHL